MAGVPGEASKALAQAIQGTIQPKLIENGWVAEENDTTLSEYITVMVADGKSVQEIEAELGSDLIGTGPDDPAVAEFANWLSEQMRQSSAPPQPVMEAAVEMQQPEQDARTESPLQDAQMDDAAAAADGVPSGPKAMRNGNGAGRGRDKRMLGQMNNHLARDGGLPDSLRRIKGAAGGQQGRINAHAGRDPPRGPKNQNLANGVQRMMNGGAVRGGRGGAMSAMNPQMNNMMNPMDPHHGQMLMQMMEMQAAMMQQMMETGQVPNFAQANGQGKSLFDRVDKRQNGHFKGRQSSRAHETQDGDAASSSMDVDSNKEPFDKVCRFNANCTNPNCPYAHQSPAAPPNQTMDLTDTCSFGAACENRKCAARHPSPAQRAQHLKQEVDCKFFPNCTNPSCPFRHPDMPLCRNGADCSVAGCKFTHSKIMCRYTPCTKPFCPFKHVEGQRGVFKDKVWTATDGVPDLDEGAEGGTSNRFASLVDSQEQPEELILPGQQDEGGNLQHESQLAS